MKTENFYGQAQYQAPRVKMVKLQIRHAILNNSITGGDEMLEGMNKISVDGWAWDDED